MNDAAWHTFLDTLDPDRRRQAQSIMARVQTVLNSDRRKTIDDVQRVERRHDRNAERINELAIRLDVYEAQRATDIRSELERIASDVLTKEEIADLLTGLYRLTARIEKLESNDQLSSEA